MATFSIWSLDDNSNVEQIIKQLLKDDGWLFEDDYGIKLEHFFTSRGQLEEALKANDILSYPLLVLLDANLDGDPSDTYGGFYAWRAIMDAITGLATEDKPVVIIYTRDQTVLQLAKPMSGEPANPIILPFAERSTVTIGDFRYGVSPFLEAALERRRSKLLKIASYKERRRAADELADRDPRPKNIKICEWDIASLFPRETKAILQNDTVKQRYIQLIVNTIMCNVCSFGDALKGFLLFYNYKIACFPE